MYIEVVEDTAGSPVDRVYRGGVGIVMTNVLGMRGKHFDLRLHSVLCTVCYAQCVMGTLGATFIKIK